MEDNPSYEVEITRDGDPGELGESRIRPAVELALRRHHCRRAALGIALVDDNRIAELNQRHLGRDGPTDVLSFDLGAEDTDVVDGQIAVSVETARREAQRRGHPVEAEVLLYCLHGTLHLLGYDDDNPDEAERMHAAEDELLTELGVGRVYGRQAE
jgi:probable rRNA maturation factor